MPDNDQFSKVAESKTVPKKRTRLSLVWVIPIVAAAAGVWIAVTRILNQGPEITIVFSTGEGLEANKTKIEYDGLEIGKLTAIKLADDHKHVIATAAMTPKTKEFLVKDLKFWVVKPRVSGLNVTGLGTLISGYYIGVQLGESKESERRFIALESPPLTGDVPGKIFMLKTPELGSLGEGTPIYYRQLQAGQVVSYELDKGGQFLNVKIFVQAPYDQYVTPDTRFWNASGVDVTLSASGLHVQTESVMSILAGGIAFETPPRDSPLPPAEAGATYDLFGERAVAFRPSARDPHNYLLVFKQSVRGLEVGAPVVMDGITIGEVTEINPQFDAQKVEFTVPVIVSVDPARYGVKYRSLPDGDNAVKNNRYVMDTLVAHGLCAQLKTGNLISGSLYVAIDMFPDEPPVALDWSQNPVQLPTKSGSIEAIEDSVGRLLKNLDKTVTSTRGTLTNANSLMLSLDKTLGTTRGALTNADRLLNNAGTLIAPDSLFNAELNNLLQQGGGAARSLRVLADYLERHPEALIRGKPGEAKP
ncbi:MAG TPA: MlaD family protein [Verrucomicrobiae bacterium]|nr:MlaD family protein [Verrucomicrobiae bacterium]